MIFENKICSKIGRETSVVMCRGTKCAQFASCMIVEIEAMEDLGVNSERLWNEVIAVIEESLK